MKVTCVNYDRNGKKTGIYFPFEGTLKAHGVCQMTASGGVQISFEEEDEFGQSTIQTIELDIQDIEVINKTKL